MKTISYHRRKFFFVPLALAGLALFVWVTMLLWNELLPVIFNFPTINFWQALGLLLLGRILFGNMHSHCKRTWPGPHMDYELRRKLKKMTPEERKEFFRKMHYNREVWHREYHGEKEQNETEKGNE